MGRVHSGALIWVLGFLVFAGCGGSDVAEFAGVYVAEYEGRPVVLTLAQDGNRLNGTLSWGSQTVALEGKAAGGRVSGTFQEAGTSHPFELVLRDGQLAWAHVERDPESGEEERIELTLRRHKVPSLGTPTDPDGGCGEPKKPASLVKEPQAERDPRLVANWYQEIISNTRNTPHSVTTRVYCILRANGSYAYGGAQSIISLRRYLDGPANTGVTKGDGFVRGEWKTRGGVAYYRLEGTDAWREWGRYAFSTDSMMVYLPGGGKQLWTRY